MNLVERLSGLFQLLELGYLTPEGNVRLYVLGRKPLKLTAEGRVLIEVLAHSIGDIIGHKYALDQEISERDFSIIRQIVYHRLDRAKGLAAVKNRSHASLRQAFTVLKILAKRRRAAGRPEPPPPL